MLKSNDPRACADGATAAKDDHSLRCLCGNLLARLVPDGVELKCRRCKRRVVIPLQGRAGGTRAV